MKERTKKICGTIIAIIVAIVSITTLFSFITGYNSIPEIFARSNNSPTATPSVTITARPQHSPDETPDHAEPINSPTATPSVKITSHDSTNIVRMHILVSGTFQNMPEGHDLWVVVRVDGLYFPHKVATINYNAGTWSHDVQIGQENEDRNDFTLIAVMADESAQDTFQKWLEKMNTPAQYDLEQLPAGITQSVPITVTRK